MKLTITIALTLVTLAPPALSQDRVELVSSPCFDGPAAHGIAQLRRGISDRGIAITTVEALQQAKGPRVIVTGLASERPVAELVRASGLKLPRHPEALSICRIQEHGRHTVVLCGGGPVGLMYGALDAANREYRATITDLKILAYLAKYHSSRMKAAVWYNVYLQSKDRFALERCITDESRAVENWRRIIESAGDVYPKTLKFGVHRIGFSWHWTDELARLEQGLRALRTLPGQAILSQPVRDRLLRRRKASPTESLSIRVGRAPAAKPGRDLAIAVTVQSESELKWIRLRYRHLTQFEDYESADMRLDPSTGKYVATIPGSSVVPEWDLMYFVEALAKNGDGRTAPDMEKGMPYVIVPVQR